MVPYLLLFVKMFRIFDTVRQLYLEILYLRTEKWIEEIRILVRLHGTIVLLSCFISHTQNMLMRSFGLFGLRTIEKIQSLASA